MSTRPMAKVSLDELHLKIEKGHKAMELMRPGSFFKEIFVPDLERDMGEIEGALTWRPGMTEKDVGQIALDRVWKSGILYGMGKMWEKLNTFKNEGAEAEKELGLRED